jgi:hypothetical protein
MRRLREAIRRRLLAGAPPLPRVVRLSLVLAIVATGFVCYYFRLTSARGFGVIGLSFGLLVAVVRRWLWERQKARS